MSVKSEKLAAWIRHPEKIGIDDLKEIEDLINCYPFFQTARILYLKALYIQAGTRFRKELKAGTVHLTDHKQLYRYLNNQILFENEITPFVCNSEADHANEPLGEINGQTEAVSPKISGRMPQEEATSALVLSIDLDRLEENLPLSESPATIQEAPLQTPEILSSGYQLTEKEPISAIPEQTGKEKGQTRKRKKKEELIDQFIQSDPVRPKIDASTTDNRDLSKENPFIQEELFSETLAKIYVRQHLYEKAIATYIKLSLKYPEKSVYFADRIEKIKENINNKE